MEDLSQSFRKKMDIVNAAESQRGLMMRSESFSLAGSFMSKKDTNVDSKATITELLKHRQLKINLICSCLIWLMSSFNFYLITFYLKSFPGSIYVNSICFAGADMIAFLSSGIILKKLSISQGLTISYSTSLVAGIAYLFLFRLKMDSVIPVIVFFSRIGGSMSFNIGYISVARLFPT